MHKESQILQIGDKVKTRVSTKDSCLDSRFEKGTIGEIKDTAYTFGIITHLVGSMEYDYLQWYRDYELELI